MSDDIPDFVRDWINLAQVRLGAQPVYCTDDFFAECSRMLEPQAPVFKAHPTPSPSGCR